MFNLFHLVAHTLITRVLRHTPEYAFCRFDKKIGIILIHSTRQPLLCWLMSFFLFDNLREKRSVPPNKYVLHILTILAAHRLCGCCSLLAASTAIPHSQGHQEKVSYPPPSQFWSAQHRAFSHRRASQQQVSPRLCGCGLRTGKDTPSIY